MQPRSSVRLRISHAAALAVLCLLPTACAARQETTTRLVAQGVTYIQQIRQADGPLIVNILRVDLSAPGVKVKCGLANDRMNPTGRGHGLERVASIVARSGAVAGVNADYFPYSCDPVGLAVRDGELLSEPLEYRACLGISAFRVFMDVLSLSGEAALPDGPSLPIDGVNRTVEQGETVLYTPTFAANPKLPRPAVCLPITGVQLPVKVSHELSGSSGAAIDLKAGDPLPTCPPDGVLLVASGPVADRLKSTAPGSAIRVQLDLTENGVEPSRGRFPSRADSRGRGYRHVWTDIEQAVGGGPWLVRNGEVSVDSDAENFQRESFVQSRHARTAAGVTTTGVLLLVTVDRRAEASRGASLDEMAHIMKDLGAVNAINLDGGGSSTMSIGGGVVNAPSDGRARPVADMLLVFAEPMTGNDAPDTLHIVAGGQAEPTLTAGDTLALTVAGEGDHPSDLPVVWSTIEGTGFVTQRGQFRTTAAGDTTIRATVGKRLLTMRAHILPAAPAKLRAAFAPEPNSPPDRNLLSVTLQDKFANGIAGVKLSVHLQGGELQSELITDSSGKASAEVVWDAPAGSRSATIQTESGISATIRN